MKETLFLQEGFRKLEPEIIDPYYYVCGGRYTYKELDEMTGGDTFDDSRV